MEMLVASLTSGTAEALRAGHAWYAARQAIEAATLAAAADPNADPMEPLMAELRAEKARGAIDALEQRATAAVEALPDGITYLAVQATVDRDHELMADILAGRVANR